MGWAGMERCEWWRMMKEKEKEEKEEKEEGL